MFIKAEFKLFHTSKEILTIGETYRHRQNQMFCLSESPLPHYTILQWAILNNYPIYEVESVSGKIEVDPSNQFFEVKARLIKPIRLVGYSREAYPNINPDIDPNNCTYETAIARKNLLREFYQKYGY